MKEQPSTPAMLTVTQEEMANEIVDSHQWRMLATFVIEERSLSEAASILNLKLPALSYRVNKWLDLGLLEITREEKRQGRAIKYYRAVSDRFFIPFSLTKSETLEDLLIALTKSTFEAAQRETAHILRSREGNWGFLFQSSDDQRGLSFSASIIDNSPSGKAIPESEQPALYETFSKAAARV